ncbi:hypothetical protein AMTRI_Chr10g3030 [Amborella trichopoda]|uniref:X8 domain-containing protein n=1 Tax=Amborella trichopoda TaxID=13333 RepID=W1PTJ8_AMBTC|nr:glucan endo-1,3-beta-glucosidase 12 isoform X2 [Amborella trichopoda]ERN10615.1 hypothetical protein AMTR_s00028p00159770 [Amborella trichopoda]|eukprot:XP_020525842.1 glucan endo-1,3-beta-glucosidase 12 isoform X2 [Amborella trichopoda]
MASRSMALSLIPWILVALLSLNLPLSDGDDEKQWCIADPQTTDEQLQGAMNWACGTGGVNCTKIQPGGECYDPNIVVDHASYVFNDYWQRFKNQGAYCYFNAVALNTGEDPSHGSCKFECLP